MAKLMPDPTKNQSRSLEPRFSLVITGSRAGLQQPAAAAAAALLARLKLSSQELQQLMNQAPSLLAQHRDSSRLKFLQQRLFEIGIESRIEAGCSYRGLVIPQQLSDWLTSHADQSQPTLKSFALIHIHPQPSLSVLESCSQQCPHGQAYALSRTAILLQLDPPARLGAGRQLQDIHDQILQQLNAADNALCWRLRMSFALWPEDAQDVPELMDCLIDRLQFQAPDTTLSETPFKLPVVAGRCFAEILKLGPRPDRSDGLSQSAADYLEAHWPLEALYPIAPKDPQRSEKLPRLLGEFSARHDERKLRGSVILQNLHGRDQFPSLPELPQQIIRIANAPDAEIEELVRLVKNDPGLSARLLSSVNSTAYGLRQDVESIEHSVVILGFEEISQLAMAISSEALFKRLGPERGQKLWRHASMAAQLAAGLARKLGQPRGRVFTSALLHDVGQIALNELTADAPADIQTRSQRLQLPEYEIERELFGFDHALIGAYMLRRWGLPEPICLAVEQHHGPQPGHQGISLTAAIVGLADHLAHESSQSQLWARATRLRACHAQALAPALQAIGGKLNELIDATQPRDAAA